METANISAAERIRIKNRRYYLANKERLNAYSRQYAKAHKEEINAQVRSAYDDRRKAAKKAYYERNRQRILAQKQEYFVRKKDAINAYRERNKKTISAQNSRWHKQNRDRIRARKRESSRLRYQNPHNRVASSVRRRIGKLLRGKSKPDRSEMLLGCGFEEFVRYISAMFKPGMSMENYGKSWHIDHIMPCSAFDLTKETQVRQCFHFTNLRPMWAKANLRKSSKITDPQLRLLL